MIHQLENSSGEFSLKNQKNPHFSDKILELIHQKICKAFHTEFIMRKKFENEVEKLSNSWIQNLKEYSEEYTNLLEKKDKSLIRITQNEYCYHKIEQTESNRRFAFNRQYDRYNSEKITEDSIAVTVDEKMKFENEYLENVKIMHKDFTMTFVAFFNKKIKQKGELDELTKSFWDYIKKYFNQFQYSNESSNEIIEQISKAPELIIENFCKDYLSNKYIKLLDIAQTYLNELSLSGFETIVVNVGNRSYIEGRYGWGTHEFKVKNNEKYYNYVSNTKDELGINDEFINIFILQKKYLIKVSISPSQNEQTKFLIWKDCEKLTVKNEVEIHIAKHHGNETIIFDTRNDAISFQSKILEIKEGKSKY